MEGDNTSTGAGVKGTSSKGNGVVGTTNSKGSSQSTSHAGVLGQDLQTGGGVLNSGVLGSSTNGTGVQGTSTNGLAFFGTSARFDAIHAIGAITGVLGQGALFGIEGQSNSTGVWGSGTTEAVEAQNSATGDAFFANGQGGDLFRGSNSLGINAFVVDDAGNVSATGTVDASNDVEGLEGLFGSQSISGQGVVGASASEGVEGENSSTGDAIFANGFGGLLFRANNSSQQNVFEVDDTGEVYAVGYAFISDATKLQHTTNGQTVETYSSQATQPMLEDDGEAQLVNGVARVALDPAFGATIDRSNYMVQVTPEGMTRGVLCVVQRAASGFVVQENMGGRSSVPFSYRIVAKPYGSTAPRLPLATIPGRFGERVNKTRVVPHLYHAPRNAKTIIKPFAPVHN